MKVGHLSDNLFASPKLHISFAFHIHVLLYRPGTSFFSFTQPTLQCHNSHSKHLKATHTTHAAHATNKPMQHISEPTHVARRPWWSRTQFDDIEIIWNQQKFYSNSDSAIVESMEKVSSLDDIWIAIWFSYESFTCTNLSLLIWQTITTSRSILVIQSNISYLFT